MLGIEGVGQTAETKSTTGLLITVLRDLGLKDSPHWPQIETRLGYRYLPLIQASNDTTHPISEGMVARNNQLVSDTRFAVAHPYCGNLESHWLGILTAEHRLREIHTQTHTTNLLAIVPENDTNPSDNWEVMHLGVAPVTFKADGIKTGLVGDIDNILSGYNEREHLISTSQLIVGTQYGLPVVANELFSPDFLADRGIVNTAVVLGRFAQF